MDRDAVAVTFSVDDASMRPAPIWARMISCWSRAHIWNAWSPPAGRSGGRRSFGSAGSIHEPVEVEHPERPTWVQIDMGAIAYNVRRSRRSSGRR